MFSLIISVLYFIFTLVVYFLVLVTSVLVFFKVYTSLTKGKCTSNAKLDGKVALVTGGNSGIGFETAKDLAKRGARVVIASRDVVKSAKAVEDIISTTGNKNVEQRYLDLASFSSVRKFAEEFNKTFDRLDILINNSGTCGLRHKLTADGIDVVTQINYFGPFLLTNLLLDKIIVSRPSRIVIVSSRAHLYAKLNLEDLPCQSKTTWFTIYANTKLLNVLWAKALAKHIPDGVIVNVLHPGVVDTDIFNNCGPTTRKIVRKILGTCFKTIEEGAQTSIYLAVSEEVEHISGRYFVDCRISEESKDVQNENLIQEVWKKSFEITGS